MGWLGVLDEQSLLVEEYRLRFLERHPMLSLVRLRLPRIPIEPDLVHGALYTYSVYMCHPLSFPAREIEPKGTCQLTFRRFRRGHHRSVYATWLRVRCTSSPCHNRSRPCRGSERSERTRKRSCYVT